MLAINSAFKEWILVHPGSDSHDLSLNCVVKKAERNYLRNSPKHFLRGDAMYLLEHLEKRYDSEDANKNSFDSDILFSKCIPLFLIAFAEHDCAAIISKKDILMRRSREVIYNLRFRNRNTIAPLIKLYDAIMEYLTTL